MYLFCFFLHLHRARKVFKNSTVFAGIEVKLFRVIVLENLQGTTKTPPIRYTTLCYDTTVKLINTYVLVLSSRK
jgi:hypothetical protein